MAALFYSLTLFLILLTTFFSLPQSNHMPAKVYSAEITSPVLASELLFPTLIASPSPTIVLPFQDSYYQTAPEIPATISAQTQGDFCLNVPVIMYHHIQPMDMAKKLGHDSLTVDSGKFEEQMKYLVSQGYTAVGAETLIESLYNRQQLPPKSVVVTIDDGYDDNYTYAFLVAKKYNLVMNFMIPTDLIGTSGYMNWDHVKEMAMNPYARLYNHTASHAELDKISQDEIRYEITDAMSDMQNNLHYYYPLLTYPYGQYNQSVIDTATSLGLKGAFTTKHGNMHCLSKVMELPRYHVANEPLSSLGL